jgi:hypothetical protein
MSSVIHYLCIKVQWLVYVQLYLTSRNTAVCALNACVCVCVCVFMMPRINIDYFLTH